MPQFDYPLYHQEMLYFENDEERTLVCTNMGMEEVWSYQYSAALNYADALENEILLYIKTNRILQHFEIFENGVLLVIRNLKDGPRHFFLESVVFLDGNGVEIWKYVYPWKSVPLINLYPFDFDIIGNRVFLSREGGFMDVFDVDTGEKL